MADLTLAIESAEAVKFAAVPTLAFKLCLANTPAEEPVHSVVLRCQIQIETTRRSYTPLEQEQLLDLFGEPDQWSRTLRTMLWTHVSVVVPAFVERTVVDVPVPCSFDFNVAATKYFHGLRHGDIPLSFLFSGTVFHQTDERALQVSPISWEKEARFRMPVQAWRDLMQQYYPNGAWLRVRQDVFDRLYQYKMRGGIPTWEEALERLLADVEERVPS